MEVCKNASICVKCQSSETVKNIFLGELCKHFWKCYVSTDLQGCELFVCTEFIHFVIGFDWKAVTLSLVTESGGQATPQARPGPGCTTTSQTDPPSAKAAPVGCQLATMAPDIKTVTIPKDGLHGRSCHLIWGVSASGLS